MTAALEGSPVRGEVGDGEPTGAGRPRRPTRDERARRQDNRRRQLLDAAARLFREHGFDAASMRHIAAAVGMLPGSVYYHFESKDELLAAVYDEGIRQVSEAVEAAVAEAVGPWARLEAACAAHLEALLGDRDYAAVVIGIFPRVSESLRARLAARRDEYEQIFRDLVEALPLDRARDRHYLRLGLLGSLNWAETWYRPDGDRPADIARAFVGLLRRRLDPEAQP